MNSTKTETILPLGLWEGHKYSHWKQRVWIRRYSKLLIRFYTILHIDNTLYTTLIFSLHWRKQVPGKYTFIYLQSQTSQAHTKNLLENPEMPLIWNFLIKAYEEEINFCLQTKKKMLFLWIFKDKLHVYHSLNTVLHVHFEESDDRR